MEHRFSETHSQKEDTQLKGFSERGKQKIRSQPFEFSLHGPMVHMKEYVIKRDELNDLSEFYPRNCKVKTPPALSLITD